MTSAQHQRRSIIIPASVQHYILGVTPRQRTTSTKRSADEDNDATGAKVVSTGQLLTTAYQAIQALYQTHCSSSRHEKQQTPLSILLVLTRSFGMSTKTVVDALQHFHCQPKPDC